MRWAGASALITTYRQVGILVGMAVTSTLFSTRTAFHRNRLISETVTESMADALIITPAFHDVLYLGILLQAVALLLCIDTARRSKASEKTLHA